jgi:putative ABC transport system substrate-binding protein
MTKSTLFWLLATIFLTTASIAEAQSKAKVPRVGVLEPGLATNVCNDGLRQGLRALGYVESQNLVIETRPAEWQPDRLQHFATELVQLKPDVIWTHGPLSVGALKRATTTIPIILGVSRNLVELGIVSSLARPGGNVTGMDLRDDEILGKRLELLKEALPKTSHVAVLADPNDAGHANIPRNIEQEAHALRVQLQRVEASGREAFDKAFAAMAQNRTDALILPESPMLSQNRQRIFELATAKRLPTISGGQHFAEAGSLMSYGASVGDICRRSAVFVDKILKGSKPADLPVERPTKFEMVVNLKTAKQIGLTIPQSVLYRADKVIK